MDKKAQNILQLLMNYGWALAVVAIALATLVYFGVFNPAKILPDQANVGQVVAVKDFKVAENSITFTFENKLGKPLYDFKVRVLACDNGQGAESDPIRIGVGATKQVTMSCGTNKPIDGVFTSQIVTSYSTMIADRASLSATTLQAMNASNFLMNHTDGGNLRAQVQARFNEGSLDALEFEYGDCDVNITSCGYSSWSAGLRYCIYNDINLTGNCFNVTVDDAIIDLKGKELHGIGSSNTDAIIVSGADNVIITNGIISGYSDTAVFAQNSNYLVISNMVIEDTPIGISLSNSDFVNISDILIINSTSFGIYMTSSDRIRLDGIEIDDSDTGIFSDGSYSNYSDITSTSNTIGISLSNSNYNHFEDLYFSDDIDGWLDEAKGIYTDNSDYNTYENITCLYESNCIDTIYSDQNSFDEVNSFDGYIGISIIYANSNNLTNSYFDNNEWGGVQLSNSNYFNIINNIAESGGDGLFLSTITRSNITNFTANSNSFKGLEIIASTDITFNHITANSNTLEGINITDISTGMIFNNVTSLSNGHLDFGCNHGSIANGSDNNFVDIRNCSNGWPVFGEDYADANDCEVYITSCTETQAGGFWQDDTTYCVTEAINLGETGICFDISGTSNMVLNGLSHDINGINNGDAIHMTGIFNLVVKNLSLTDFAATGIVINSTEYVTVSDISMTSVYNGIELNGVDYSSFSNLVLSAVGYSNAFGLDADDADYNNYTNIVIVGDALADYATGVSTDGDYNLFSNISVSSLTGDSSNGFNISGNFNNFSNIISYNNSQYGIYLDSNTFNNYLINITANGNAYGIKTGKWADEMVFYDAQALGNSILDFSCGSEAIASGFGNEFDRIYACPQNSWPVVDVNYVDPYDCDFYITTCSDDDGAGFWQPGTYCIVADLSSVGVPNCLNIDSNDVIVKGNNHAIAGSASDYGVTINYQRNIVLENIDISSFSEAGIYLKACNYTTIYNSTLTGNFMGILLDYDYMDYIGNYFSNISHCTVSSSDQHGITGMYGAGNNYEYNLLDSNTFYGIYLDYHSSETINNNTILSNGMAGIWFRDGSNSNITNNFITGSSTGIYIDDCTGISAVDNLVFNSTYGLGLSSSTYCTVDNFTASYINNTYTVGVMIDGQTSYSNLSNINVSSYDHGIEIYGGSSYNQLVNLTASNNNIGIIITEGFPQVKPVNNTIRNAISNLNQYGMYFGINASNNTVFNSTFNNNSIKGIHVGPNITGINITNTVARYNRNDFVGNSTSNCTGFLNIFGNATVCNGGWPVLGVHYTTS